MNRRYKIVLKYSKWLAVIIIALFTELSAKGIGYIGNFGFWPNKFIMFNSDTNTLTVTNTNRLPTYVAMSPDQQWVYSVNKQLDFYSVASGSYVNQIDVKYNSLGWVRATPDGSKIFTADDYWFSVVDPVGQVLIMDVAVPGKALRGFDIAPNVAEPHSNLVVFACVNTDEVIVVDMNTLSVIKTISVGDTPYDVTISPYNERAYVVNVESDTVTVINLDTLEVETTFNLAPGDKAYHINASPDDKWIYVSCDDSQSIKVYDSTTYSLETTIENVNNPSTTAFSLADNRAYTVASPASNGEVVVTDMTTHAVLERIPNPGNETPYQDIVMPFEDIPRRIPLPPTDLTAERKSNRFPFQTEYSDKLSWKASPDPSVTLYKIYKDGVLIQTLASNQALEFVVHMVKKHKTTTYKVTVINNKDLESPAATITIN